LKERLVIQHPGKKKKRKKKKKKGRKKKKKEEINKQREYKKCIDLLTHSQSPVNENAAVLRACCTTGH